MTYRTTPARLFYRADLDLPYGEDDGRVQVAEDGANVVSSLCEDGLHRPALDIDLPCELIPSSTAGRFHLYIDKALSDEDYLWLVTVMAEVGIIEAGYLKGLVQRGATFLRKPGVHKTIVDTLDGEPSLL